MSETSNIAIMAKKVADDIFAEFGWQQKGPVDTDWACVAPEKHKSKKGRPSISHPSDVVFWYEDPYDDAKVFLNLDLKSYAEATLTKAQVRGAVTSLCKSVECANVSSEWSTLYGDNNRNYRCHGLLFVYNHDGQYIGKFEDLFEAMPTDALPLEGPNRLFIVGPDTISYLATVANDIARSRGKLLPAEISGYKFFYPDLIGPRPKSQNQTSASVEVLLSPWQIIRYSKADNETNAKTYVQYIVYYRGTGASVDEFKYLFDAFFRFQMLGDEEKITVRMPFAQNQAHVHFDNAKDAYVNDFYNLKEFRSRLNRITFEPISVVIREFSSINLGMSNG